MKGEILMNSFDDNLQYIKIINDFKQINNLCNGKSFLAKIDVEDQKRSYLYADTCECFIFDDRRFQEYRIEILWQFDDSQLKRMGIAKSYNTQFQKFDLDDKKLVIESNNRYIILECVNYDD